MLRLAQPGAGQRTPPTGGAGNGHDDRGSRLGQRDGKRAPLLASAGALYFAAAELAPFDRIDAWLDERFFLAHRTPDKFTRSLCPVCLERLAS